MEGRAEKLRRKLEQMLLETAEVAVELDRADGTIKGVPHYSVIELRAHELGRQLSRNIQQRQMAEVAAEQTPRAACPDCGKKCELKSDRRKMRSVDGRIDLHELVGYCPGCRRSFFPAADETGL